MLAPVRVTAPAEQPVSLAEAKAHLRVDHSDDDALIDSLLAAAVGHLDGWSGILGRALITQTWRLDMPSFGYPIRLPLAPVQSATIAYSDTDNADQAFAEASFALLTDATGPYVALVSGASWPSVYSRGDAVRVTFVAGYGDATAVPAAIKAAILLMVGHWYEHRSTVVDGNVMALPFGAEALLSPYRRAFL